MEAKTLNLDRFKYQTVVPGNGYSPFTGYTVFKAYDTKLNKNVAVKCGRKPKNAHWTLFEEYDILKNINHDGIVKVYDFGCCEDTNYFVMEGFNLGGRRSRWRNILEFATIEVLEKFVDRMLSILFYLQENRILHEDVELANIVANQVTSPVLIDFGRVHRFTYDRRSLIHWLPPDRNTRMNAWVRELCGIGGQYELEGAIHPIARSIIEDKLKLK